MQQTRVALSSFESIQYDCYRPGLHIVNVLKTMDYSPPVYCTAATAHVLQR